MLKKREEKMLLRTFLVRQIDATLDSFALKKKRQKNIVLMGVQGGKFMNVRKCNNSCR